MSRQLRLEPRIEQADDFYQKLIDMHRDLDEQQSRLVNAKLILLLANHIGEREILDEAIARARSDL